MRLSNEVRRKRRKRLSNKYPLEAKVERFLITKGLRTFKAQWPLLNGRTFVDFAFRRQKICIEIRFNKDLNKYDIARDVELNKLGWVVFYIHNYADLNTVVEKVGKYGNNTI